MILCIRLCAALYGTLYDYVADQYASLACMSSDL